jgi:hypothetical protein
MVKLSIPQWSDEKLFEATLEPMASTVDKLTKGSDIGELEINTFRGRKNTVVVGKIYYENLIRKFIDEKEEIPHEIKQMMGDYDFHYVSLSCSFLPDKDCRFVWARFGVELSARSKRDEPHEERPIAYDMVPNEVLSETKYKREVNLSPEGKLSLGEATVGIKGVDVKTQKELVIYEPQIFAHGIGRSKVSWDFRSTKEKGIWGNKCGLLLTIRTPKNSKVKGRFLLAGEVEFNIGKWIPIALSKRADSAVDHEYDFSE